MELGGEVRPDHPDRGPVGHLGVVQRRRARDAVINIANSYPAATAIISQREIAEQVKAEVERSLDPYGVVIDSVSIPAIDLDSSTQATVDRLFTTQQDIKRAQNEQRRAEIDAETTQIREAEGALTPAADQRYCLEIVNSWDIGAYGPSLPDETHSPGG